MRTRTAAVLGALLLTCAHAPGSPAAPAPPPGVFGDPAVVEQIRVIENERLEAGVRGDVGTMAAAVADTYMQIDLAGRALDKATSMKRVQGAVKGPGAIRISEMVVRVYGDTAIVTALSRLEDAPRGSGITAIRYSRVYVKEDGRWRVVHFQQTPVARDAS